MRVPPPSPTCDPALAAFSPPVRDWFAERLGAPTAPQQRAWPAVAGGGHVLVSAPTGSGKTLAAFLLVLDRLIRRAEEGALEDRLEAVYVSPMRALSHDVQKNLREPLAEIGARARAAGDPEPGVRVLVRTGDTPQAERAAMLRRPPHVLVTTPESLYLLVTAARSREMLRTVRTVIVDEIHAVAGDRRGAHLALTLERLAAVADEPFQRIGLSATARPIEELARHLTGVDPGGAPPACTVIDLGHRRRLDLAVAVPAREDLQAVAPQEHWDDLLDQVAELVRAHRTTLVFVNTRRLAERVAHRLQERLGEERVAAHHGSMSRDRRLDVEQRLKAGRLDALVATASLELGIDIGSVELVCQIQSPRSIASFLQRVGRSGHALGRTPKGRLFPTTRDELVECAALVRAARAGHLDRIGSCRAPLDILAQQVVAHCAHEGVAEDDLFALVRRARPYAGLDRRAFEEVLDMLADGFETPSGRRGRHVHRDRVQREVRGRRGARIAAATSGGAIPDTGEYRVVLDPDDTVVGTVDEDWAVESMAGDIFLLGTHTWQIRRVENGVVRVTDARGMPPTIPFWFGEGPGRTPELSSEVSGLRDEILRQMDAGVESAAAWAADVCVVPEQGAEQLVRYVRAQHEALGVVPTGTRLLAERFFDDSGGMQLVIHCPHGARVNRAVGLLLRKRLCRAFNQELQAAASDDAIVLSLGNPQTFELGLLQRLLRPSNAARDLEQAVLGAPMFAVRWRWNAGRSLAVLRHQGGRPVPFNVQRMRAEDLLAAAFPDQTACQEHVSGPIEIPDHPLVRQTLDDCLHEVCDLDGALALLEDLEQGDVALHVADTVEPSPFAHEILNARPYAFLDDAPLEERRTRAVALRHALPDDAKNLAELDTEAIDAVRAEAAPDVRDSDDLHELASDLVLLPLDELPPHPGLVRALVDAGRATRARAAGGAVFLVATERLAAVRVLHPEVALDPPLEPPDHLPPGPTRPEDILDAAVRGHLALCGPVRPADLAARLALPVEPVTGALVRLAAKGVLLAGCFDARLEGRQYCERSLLARIHRRTLGRLRREIEPVSAQDYLRFLVGWQHLLPDTRAAGQDGLLRVLGKLSGWSAPAGVWERDILPARVDGYHAGLLDELCLSGRAAWGRLDGGGQGTAPTATRATPIAIFLRDDAEALLHGSRLPDSADGGDVGGPPADGDGPPFMRGPAQRIHDLLRERGALFLADIETGTGLLPWQLEEGLFELVARGLLTSDGFAPFRALLRGATSRTARARRDARRRGLRGRSGAVGRWVLLRPLGQPPPPEELAETSARRLLDRYGVVFRDIVLRESLPAAWRAVHRALRRLEARGEVRGGRFVSGFTGEQFALPAAVPLLRETRRRPREGREVIVSAADPLNLAGVLTPERRVPATSSRHVVILDGRPAFVVEGGARAALAPLSGDG